MVVLLASGVVAAVAGWTGWLVSHSGQAWQWVRQWWLASSALTVIIAALAVWATLATGRRQVRSAERLAAQQHAREDEHAAREWKRIATERQVAWEQRCRELLVYWPLPKVAETDPYQLGVFYSRRADAYRADRKRPPYVPRAVDAELTDLLQSQPLVLVKGQSRAGKSRTAYEVAARELGDWRLLAPTDRAALAVLPELDPLPSQGERVLVWLDDLDEYLAVEGARGLDAALLGRWATCDPPVKVLATIRLEEYGRLIETPGELGRSVRELLNQFDRGALTLPTTFNDPGEQAAIAELYTSEQLIGGLAEHLAATHELVNRLEVGQARVPEGAGLVLAAVDCHRAGLDRPIAKMDLAALLPLYLKQLRPLLPMQEGDVDRGLDWATEPVGRTAALLIGDPGPLAGTFRVADPIVDYVERRDGRKLAHPAIWERLLARVSLEEAVDIAFAAYTRGEPSTAMAALQQVVDSGHRDHAPMAAIILGVLSEEQGDMDGAKAAYHLAIDSNHPDKAPEAAIYLGLLLRDEGDPTGAKAAYNLAIDSSHPEHAPAAATDLGTLLEEQGDVDAAKAAYRLAIDSHHPDEAPAAAAYLGSFLAERGDVDAAKAAYRLAIDLYPARSARAALLLGRLLEAEGDLRGALAAYQQVGNRGHPAVRAAAQRAVQRLDRSN
jgi:TolA-binding protein